MRLPCLLTGTHILGKGQTMVFQTRSSGQDRIVSSSKHKVLWGHELCRAEEDKLTLAEWSSAVVGNIASESLWIDPSIFYVTVNHYVALLGLRD